ncbi:hypothetical protein [uncultured Fibrobacter sp.]|uniref:hypothetical protein n=1 Tax=uncultured Fibrobacter sp. TaxID=261512 RepID=UPI0028044F35|nr:hypothetical protein [uncultured Fibrobacter sp.]
MSSKDWETKDLLLALFLCMVFVVTIAYGMILFVGVDMRKMECIVKVSLSIMLAGIGLFSICLIAALIGQTWKTESSEKKLENQTFKLEVEEAHCCPRTVKVTILNTNSSEDIPKEDK